MSGIPAEEIAEDYRFSLEALQTPDRYAINNLTVIAKESTEHADAISNVLIEHIKKVPPHHKLPALYVLDSIAKNIGAPYTTFLGSKLYMTFMGAYSSVDASTRRKMDEMLKTWKSPVPGAIDPRPVFPKEYTQRIDNALIQARTAVLRHEQNNPLAFAQKRPGSALGTPQWRDTPTPPQPGMQYPPPTPSNFNAGLQPNYPQPLVPGYTNSPAPHRFYPQTNVQQPYPGIPQPSGQPNYPYQQYQSTPQQAAPYAPPAPVAPGPDLNALNQDIDQLIVNCKQEFSTAAPDSEKMTKLNALVALQKVINMQQLPADQLFTIRRQVDDLQAADRRNQAERAAFRPVTHTPAPQPPAPTPLSALLSQVNRPPPGPPPALTPDPRLHPGPPQANIRPPGPDLASLLASAGQSAAASTPQPASTVNQNLPSVAAPPPSDYSSLLASLTKSGVMTNVASRPAPSNGPTPVPQPAPISNNSSQSLATLLALANSRAPVVSANTVELSSASLKLPRPHLIKALFSQRPSQCVTCGRRFPTGPNGKAEKDKHMDWHFRTNQRIQDASKGIQSRSWYIGELEWIRAKDGDEERGTDGVNAHGQNTGTNGPAENKESYISVPSDSESNQTCPICQEPFDTEFNQEAQDWVWRDAKRSKNKIYHASCLADMQGGGLEPRERTATPDSVLGKRKAEAPISEPSPAKRVAPSVC